MKIEHPEIEDVDIQSQIKEEMIKEFQNLTPKEEREMVRASSVLLLHNWDITNALIFNSISNKLDILDQNKKEMKHSTFSVDQSTLLIWSIRKGSRIMHLQSNSTGMIGNIIVKRVADTTHVEDTHMNVGTSQLILATTEKEDKAMSELQSKYEKVVEAYNK